MIEWRRENDELNLVLRHLQTTGYRRIVLVLFALEALLFWQLLHRNILRVYPLGWDQVVYLLQVYRLFEKAVKTNIFAAVSEYVIRPQDYGVLLQIEAVIAGLFFGMKRATALTVVFAHWLCLQWVLFHTLSSRLRRTAWGAAGVGLLLFTKGFYSTVGGFLDFRLDATGSALLGVTVCLILLSDHWKRPRESLLAGLSCCATILTRPLLFPILAAALSIHVFFLYREKQLASVKGLGRFILPSAIVSPFLVYNGLRLLDYYWRDWKERPGWEAALHHPVSRLLTLAYYPKSLAVDHIGVAGVTALAVLIILAAASRKPGAWTSESDARADLRLVGLPAIIFFVLATLDPSKSPVVMLDIVPLVVLFVALLAGRLTNGSSAAEPISACVAALLVLGGGFNYVRFMQPDRLDEQAYRNISRMARDANWIARELHLLHPKVAMLHDNEENWNLFEIYSFEDTGRFLQYQGLMPSSHLPVSPDVVRNVVSASQLVLVSRNVTPDSLPFNSHVPSYIAAAEPLLRGDFDLFDSYAMPGGRQTSLYVRRVHPPVHVEQFPGSDWMPPVFHVCIPEYLRNRLTERTRILVQGPGYRPDNPKRVRFTVTDEEDDRAGEPASSVVQFDSGRYTLEFALGKMAAVLRNRPAACVRISSDDYFVPKQIGQNEDTRQLFLWVPDSAVLLF